MAATCEETSDLLDDELYDLGFEFEEDDPDWPISDGGQTGMQNEQAQNDIPIDDVDDAENIPEAESANKCLSLEERLRLIEDEPDDRSFLFGTCDQDMLKIMSIVAPLLEMRGSAHGFAYVNPAVSLAHALRGKTADDFDTESLNKVMAATDWLSDAWESQGSASAIEVMRNLIVSEVLNDATLRFLVLTRIEHGFRAVCSLYEDAGITLRTKHPR